jgi:hypothetical protein
MPVPSYGAAPLSTTFLGVRILQVISMIVIVGMTANFVSEIVSTYTEAPKEIVGTLSVVGPPKVCKLFKTKKFADCKIVQTCIATLYCIISIAFYWAEAQLGLFVMAGVDGLLLIAFIVVAVSLGKPLSFLNCAVVKKASSSVDAEAAYAFTMSVANNLNKAGNKLSLFSWVGTTKANCYEAKTIWGLSIALWYVSRR